MLDSAGQPMANCPQVDRQSPTLCHEHVHKQTPSLDKPDAPAVMPFVATGFALTLVWLDHGAAPPPPANWPSPPGVCPTRSCAPGSRICR
jgi:hypothetical protein